MVDQNKVKALQSLRPSGSSAVIKLGTICDQKNASVKCKLRLSLIYVI